MWCVFCLLKADVMLPVIIGVTILALIGAINFYLKSNWNYWRKRGINGPAPRLIVGNLPNILNQKKHMALDIDDIYRRYKNEEDFVGIFNFRIPQLLILKPELIRRVLVNDFKNFHDNEFSKTVDSNADPLFGQNPFLLTGEKWKEARNEITPGLTVSRIKTAYPVTTKVCNKLIEYISKESKIAGSKGLDAKDICIRFTSEMVTDTVLGLEAGSFSDKPTPILGMINQLFNQSFSLLLTFFFANIVPEVTKLYKPKFVPKNVDTFFISLVEKAINLRKNQPNQERVDYLNYLLQLQEKKNLSTTTLTSHTMTFLLDGYETTASVIAHCLLLLARYPRTQEKLRAEIDAHLKHNADIDFDTLDNMSYLNACIHEAIRIFPPGFFGSKLCTEPITLTSKAGKTITLEKGEIVCLPLYSVMNDEEYYPNPQEFQPERFADLEDGVKKYREMGLYYGFSDGPRVCMGMRFALTQSKACIVSIIRRFNVNVNPRTRSDNELHPKHFIPRLLGDIWLDFEERV